MASLDFLRKAYLNNEEDKDTFSVPDTEEAIPYDTTPEEAPAKPRSLDFLRKAYLTEPEESTPIQNSRKDKIKKEDLYRDENLTKIRAYMLDKYGTDAKELSDEQLVEGYMDSMRWFNANVGSTALEARRIMGASEEQKATASEAYELYDRLGNVFVNDGVLGAVDGVKDYIFAAAADPTNYIGLLTGGISKAAALGVTTAGKKAVMEAAKAAGEAALKKGLTKEAQDAAAKKAADEVARAIGKRTMRDPARKRIVENAAKREYELYQYSLSRGAEEKFKGELVDKAAKKGLYATAGLDATAAVLQDVMLQNTMLDVGAQEQYSLLQTGFSSLFGAVGAGVAIGAEALRGTSGLANIAAEVDVQKMAKGIRKDIEAEVFKMSDIQLKDAEAATAVKAIRDASKSWKQKVASGKKAYEDAPTVVDFIKEVMYGPDGKGGVAKIYADRGTKLPDNLRISDVMTNLVKYIPEKELAEINKDIAASGIKLGETSQVADNLRDLASYQISNAGRVLNTMSQLRKTLDAGIMHGQKVLQEQTEEATKDVTETKYLTYMQSIWRRMLVSSPATSAVNLIGFGQYFTGSSIADILTMGGTYAAAMTKPKAQREAMVRQASVYRDMITQKLRYLADPYTTKEAYMKILEEHDGVRKTLYDSLTGGVDMAAERYGIDPTSGIFKAIEATANGSAIVAGVRAQDTATKALMFMSEMDKQVRLKYNRSIQDVLRSGDTDLIDEDIMAKVLDQTQKSVFSKDYTKDTTFGTAAKLVETISQTPVLGTILPFGRFMNNVVATVHQWGPSGLMVAGVKSVGKTLTGKTGTDLPLNEALARGAVGTAFGYLAMQYDEERQGDNLGMFQLKVGDTIIDAKNTYPLSVFLATGRMFNDARKGREVTAEQAAATLEQLAVGQLASDLEFGTGLTSLVTGLLNSEEGKLGVFAESLYKKMGNFAAGYTRPLDFANKMVGAVAYNDAAKDVRQERGLAVATMSATKYVDNILEAILGEIEGVTGDELRVATREGSLRDPAPFLSAIGLRLVEGRTAGEQLLDKLDLPRFKANERTEIAAYDRAYNTVIAPWLNRKAQLRLDDPEFKKLSKDDQRAVWNNDVKDVANEIRDYLENNSSSETMLLAIQRKASAKKKSSKRAAMAYLKEEYGFDGSIRDMNYQELMAFLDYIDYYEAGVDWNK